MQIPELTLTDDEQDVLLIALGYATGAAMKDNDRKLGYAILRLTNKLNENNPNYVPYQIPDGQ
jgi:hypothetical protein